MSGIQHQQQQERQHASNDQKEAEVKIIHLSKDTKHFQDYIVSLPFLISCTCLPNVN